MESSAYTSYMRDSESVAQNPLMGASNSDALLDAYAKHFREEGRKEERQKLSPILEAKEAEIERLRAELAAVQQGYSSTNTMNVSPTPIYEYNASLFPKPYGDTIINVLIELCICKQNGGKYILNNKTDWYMVWKILHYFTVFDGNCSDLLELVNECVLPYVEDDARREALSVKKENLKIAADNPMKTFGVAFWRQELAKKRREDYEKPTQHGTFVLERGVNLKIHLQQLLQARGIESVNFE